MLALHNSNPVPRNPNYNYNNRESTKVKRIKMVNPNTMEIIRGIRVGVVAVVCGLTRALSVHEDNILNRNNRQIVKH